LKAFDTNVDQLRRDLIEKTNENRALITEIRGLEQGLKEIDQQLKQKRFQRSDDQSSYVIQCPSLDKMLQVQNKTFLSKNKFRGFLGSRNTITCWSI
jgi:phage pi2 protein 07